MLHDLVRVSDAVFNNARGDLPGKLGLTYEALKAVNPRIVCCALTGLRHHRTARRRAGLRLPDPGLRGLHVGDRRARRPARQVRRVHHRLRGRLRGDGRPHGRPLRRPAHRASAGTSTSSLLDTAVSMLSYFAIWTLNRDWAAERTRGLRRTRRSCPPRTSPPATAGSSSSATRTSSGSDLVEVLGAPEIGATIRALPTFPDRLAHRDALVPLLKARFATRTTADWLERLRGPRAVRARQRRAPGARRRAGAGARDDRRGRRIPSSGRLREVRSPIRTEGEIRHPRAGAEARRAHGRDPARDPRLQRLHHRAPAGARECSGPTAVGCDRLSSDGCPSRRPDVEEIERDGRRPSRRPWMTVLHNCDCHTFEQVVQAAHEGHRLLRGARAGSWPGRSTIRARPW